MPVEATPDGTVELGLMAPGAGGLGGGGAAVGSLGFTLTAPDTALLPFAAVVATEPGTAAIFASSSTKA